MALILEIRDRRGATTFHRLDALPLTVGRGMSNDIILDDPYVDAQHLAIECDDAGVLVVRDLGSINGIVEKDNRVGTIGVIAGTELRAGRTTFAFHDREAPVAPALIDAPVPPAPLPPSEERWTISAPIEGAVIVGTLGVIGLYTWLGSYERSSASTVLAGMFAAALLLIVWAGIWGISLRGQERRVQFAAHATIASAVVLTYVICGMINSWLSFLFPDVDVFGILFMVAVLVVLAAAIAGHLLIGTTLPRRNRWCIGAMASATLFAVLLIVGWSQSDKFSDTPRFPAQLKPISAELVPTHSVDDFVKAMSDAKKDADKAVEKGKKDESK